MKTRQGFSLLEALIASSVLMISLVGVAVMLINTSRNASQGAINVQMGLVARQLVQERISNGLANVGSSAMDQTFALPVSTENANPVLLNYDLEVIDTSGPGPLPNLGYNSRLVRVTIRRGMTVYVHEGYVSE